MRRIHPYLLWLGNAHDGRDLRAILDAEIKAVVQVAAEEPPLALTRELISCRFPLLDGPGNDPNLMRVAVMTVATLLEMRIPLLVCCGGGMSRSPVVAALALAVLTKKNPDECLKRVAEHHPADVAPGLWDDAKTLFGAGLNSTTNRANS